MSFNFKSTQATLKELMDLLLGVWLLFCIKYAVGAYIYTRYFRLEDDISAFTVMYHLNNEAFYKDIVKFDSLAAFVLDSDTLVSNRITKGVKNNQDKQAIVVKLAPSFFTNAANVNQVIALKTKFNDILAWF